MDFGTFLKMDRNSPCFFHLSTDYIQPFEKCSYFLYQARSHWLGRILNEDRYKRLCSKRYKCTDEIPTHCHICNFELNGHLGDIQKLSLNLNLNRWQPFSKSTIFNHINLEIVMCIVFIVSFNCAALIIFRVGLGRFNSVWLQIRWPWSSLGWVVGSENPAFCSLSTRLFSDSDAWIIDPPSCLLASSSWRLNHEPLSSF